MDDFHQLIDHSQRKKLRSMNSAASKIYESSKGKSSSQHTTEYKFFQTSRNATSGIRTPMSSPSIKSLNNRKEDN